MFRSYRFENGVLSNTSYVLNSLLAEYKQCERFFEGRVYDDAVALLNEEVSCLSSCYYL